MDVIIVFTIWILTINIPLFYLDSKYSKEVEYWKTQFYKEKSLVHNYWSKAQKREPIEFCEGITYVMKEVE